jgi:hypothetical protein
MRGELERENLTNPGRVHRRRPDVAPAGSFVCPATNGVRHEFHSRRCGETASRW